VKASILNKNINTAAEKFM